MSQRRGGRAPDASGEVINVATGGRISLKVRTDDLKGTIDAIRQSYEALFPGNPFEYYFADDAFDEQYQNDQRFATLFGIFAGLTILIACLGLFGLAAFTAEQRTKEIGVRKVLGASVPGLVLLLSKEFTRLVLLGLLAAVPVALTAGWTVNSELKPSPLAITSVAGVSSSQRMSIARMPPIIKKVNDVTIYCTPIILWSMLQVRYSLKAGRLTSCAVPPRPSRVSPPGAP